MELLDSERRVVEPTEGLAANLGFDDNHTLAPAALHTSGHIHTGVNVFHFTGGPCAEFVALEVAATAGTGPLIAITAAGNRRRGSLPRVGGADRRS